MGNCMGVNSYCNRGRNRNRSRPQNVGICASSTSVLNQQQNLSAPQQQQQQQQQTQQISIPIDSNISIQSGQTNPTITPDPNLTVPNSNLASGSNINQIISNHISSYNLYPYYVPPATGKNKRLKKDFHKYFKFDKKITEKQLQAKRDEFWDTAPAFDGKTEIWAALKAAVEACENKNHQLAQAIIDSANIILPNGLLNDCYDELGNRYEIPIYVLAKPSNLVKSQNNKNEISFDEDSSSCSNKHNNNKTKINDNNIVSDDEEEEIEDLDINCNNDTSLDEDNSDFDQENNNSNPTALDTIKTERKKDSKKLFLSSKSKFNNIKLKLSNRNDDKNNNNNKYDANKKSKTKKQSNNNVNKTEATTSKNKLVTLKLRVSALHNEQDDIKININLNQTVLNLKQMLQEYINVEPVHQRMFFGGKQLKDRDRLKLYRLRRNVVIQVIIKDADDDKIKANFENYLKQKEKEFLDNNNSNINNDFVFIENQIQIQSVNSSLDKPNETINELNNDESLTVINEDKVNENSNKDLILNDNLINQI